MREGEKRKRGGRVGERRRDREGSEDRGNCERRREGINRVIKMERVLTDTKTSYQQGQV